MADSSRSASPDVLAQQTIVCSVARMGAVENPVCGPNSISLLTSKPLSSPVGLVDTFHRSLSVKSHSVSHADELAAASATVQSSVPRMAGVVRVTLTAGPSADTPDVEFLVEGVL